MATREGVKQHFSMRDFKGMNTQAIRQAIKDDEFSWLENVIPIGHGNMKVIPAMSASLAVVGSGTCYYMAEGNIANVDYMFMFCTDGSAYQVNLTSFAVTKFAGAGKAFTFSLVSNTRMAQWKNERILIIDTTGYYSWDGTTLTSLGGVTGAPVSGSDIETFAGRVWISSSGAGTGRTVVFSAPNSYADFTGASFGGSFIITDQMLTSSISRLHASINYLYIFGSDSVFVVSDVRVSGATTVFSVTNISSGIGSNMPDSIVPFYRSLMFSNPYGIYAMVGANAQKISAALDGIFPSIVQSQLISAGTATIYNNICACFLFKYLDPATGSNRELIAVFFDKKWLIAYQSNSITFIASSSKAGNPTLYATDGTSLFKLFSDTTSNIAHKIQSKLWDFDDSITDKQALKLGLEMFFPSTISTISVSIDTETTSNSYTPASGGNTIIWVNNSGTTVLWQNNTPVTVQWLTPGYQFLKTDASGVGKYLGATITSSSPGATYSGVHLQFEKRATW